MGNQTKSSGCLREVLYLQYDWFMVALKVAFLS